MELSAEEESKLREMLEAFTNGKRLSDLPDVSGNNPFDFLCEVLEKGESKKAALASLLPYMEESCMYGIEYNENVSSPDVTRIGNMSLHKSLPIQNRIKGCLLDDDGNVIQYLNPLDWTIEIRDGSRGQVMVELPVYYRKFESEPGGIHRVKLSEYPLPGYHQVNRKFVSAYEASIQRSTEKLCSVVNDSADYRGGNNNAELDNTRSSLLGKPVSNFSRSQFREYARKRKPSTKEWNCLTYEVYKDIYWLFVIEYATFNSQKNVNLQKDNNGYAQGGLGKGVTTYTAAFHPSWGEFNGRQPIIPCGVSDGLGNGTGEVSYRIDGENYNFEFKVPRYRGIENIFGHIGKIADGIDIEVGREGKFMGIYITDNPELFNASDHAGYIYFNRAAPTTSKIRSILLGERGEIIPTLTGGSSTTFFCDTCITNFRSDGRHGIIWGGEAFMEDHAGLLCADISKGEHYSKGTVGTRLCFLPTNS